jgi:hypothetical protein
MVLRAIIGISMLTILYFILAAFVILVSIFAGMYIVFKEAQDCAKDNTLFAGRYKIINMVTVPEEPEAAT